MGGDAGPVGRYRGPLSLLLASGDRDSYLAHSEAQDRVDIGVHKMLNK